MRRTLLLSVIATILLVSTSERGARAQQASTHLSVVERTLSDYLFPTSATPSGLRQTGLSPLDNPTVAAAATDPADVRKIIDRARIDGVEQDFTKTDGSRARIQLQLSLFRDFAGASADLGDPVLLAGQSLTPASAPGFGDATAAYTTKGQRIDGAGILFASGRLEVLVLELGPTDKVSQDDILPLVRLMAGRTTAPPPPSMPEELAILQTQTGPESILHDAYRLLVDNYLTQLSPASILGNAYDGAVKALSQSGVRDASTGAQIISHDSEEAWAQFLPAYQQLESLADGMVTQRDLAYAAAEGLYGKLNCHTDFFTPTFYARAITSLRGKATARIGILRTRFPEADDVILRVEPNSPADLAGLKPGDQIVAVDHQTRDQVGDHLNELFIGDAGTPITLTLQRPSTPNPFDVTIVRQLIPPLIEEHRILPGGVGYIEFDAFTTGDIAVNRVGQALEDFQAAGTINSWILDLRYNGGGSVLTLERIAGLFVGSGSLLLTQKQQDGTVDTGRSIGTPVPNQKPLVVLTGSVTASAAEVLPQSLKDLQRATLVGEKTAGCINGGLPFGLLDGSGVFVSTFEARAGPNKVALENVGVLPDVPAKLSLSDLVSGDDPQLAIAIAVATGAPLPTPATSGLGTDVRPSRLAGVAAGYGAAVEVLKLVPR